MRPILVEIPWLGGSRPLPSYGLCLLLGCALAITLAVVDRRRRLPPFDAFALGLIALGGGLLGGFAAFVAVHGVGAVLAQGPGLVFYGGLLGGAITALLYLRAYDLPLASGADLAALALPFGHALGRLGCFLGGCCYGRATDGPLGVRFTDPAAPASALSALVGPLHQVQLYESVGLLLLGTALQLADRCGRPRPGRLFIAYLGLYALLRLLTERFRGDDAARGAGLGPVSPSHLAAAGALLVAAVLYARRRHHRGRT